ncbi:hypothetical protein LTR35_012018 [Friedmanniomyces endolithicus]|nr:hypothetical protein LTR35_012018 [Friedmanniomyces endolithicus]
MARPRSKAPPPLKFDTCATRLKADPSRLSLLLDLIPELRNAIYEYVFASTGGVLLSRHAINRAIAPRESALLYVNKQVHTEFLHAAWLLADIHTTSLDYDFRHVVTFLNRHNDEEIRALPSKLFPRHRAIVVEIEPGSYGDGMPQYLERWLNRFGHPTKEGAQVHFEHRLRPGYKSDRKASSECWRVYMEMIPGRRLEEFKSIIAARVSGIEGDRALTLQDVHAELQREDWVKVATGRSRSRKVMEADLDVESCSQVLEQAWLAQASRREHGVCSDVECVLDDRVNHRHSVAG